MKSFKNVFEASQETVQARPSLHLSKYHIVGNHMSRLVNDICNTYDRLLYKWHEIPTHYIVDLNGRGYIVCCRKI